MEQIAYELHRPARRIYPRRHYKLERIGDTWQMDLIDLNNLSTKNNNYSYILVVIDIFTKFVWTRAIKNKSSVPVRNALEDVIKSSPYGPPRNIHSDAGNEFTNPVCRSLYKKYGINFYQTYTTMKASIAERVIRTLKEKIFRLFTQNHNAEWINIYEGVTDEYNRTKHRSTNMRPIDVKDENDEQKIKLFMFDQLRKNRVEKNFAVGDFVRISKYKSIFAKGYTANWTTEIFQIKKIFSGHQPTYVLEDQNGEEIVGVFYPEEMQKTNFPDTYLLERVVRKNLTKGTAVVKFYGFERDEEIPLVMLIEYVVKKDKKKDVATVKFLDSEKVEQIPLNLLSSKKV